MARYHHPAEHHSKPVHHHDHHEHEVSDGYYAGEGARRREEAEDMHMITEDRMSIANMPQHVMIKAYPKKMDYLPEDLDDTIRGVDEQRNLDDSKRREHFRPKKV
jgi:hypothetical protein